ncbi:MAG: hypothetical protein ACLUH4_06460 [Alphaproteobacteria bacterium]|uniref:cell division protein FtsL n=1 Tax=Candidatus Scatocola faecigallinarum TaxID=2840916 RepID=UPI00033A771E|nr:periplasmic protein TonB [Azospirillum sp. CAG:239]
MNSTRTATLSLWVTLTCLVGFGMFVMKNQVQNLENELASINRNIEEDVKTIHILKAEWSHLNNPSRLRALATKHISLNQVKAEQIINYSALPFDYEQGESGRRLLARKNISDQAERNKELKRLVKAQR